MTRDYRLPVRWDNEHDPQALGDLADLEQHEPPPPTPRSRGGMFASVLRCLKRKGEL